jgi:hypothetical protein
LRAALKEAHGRRGLERLAAELELAEADRDGSPFDWLERLMGRLEAAPTGTG